MPEPSIGRVVIYRSKVGEYDVPAIITATQETLHPEGVELFRESGGSDGVPPLSSPDHVHLTVLTPGLSSSEPPKPLDANMGGTYREWNVPMFEPRQEQSPVPGTVPTPVDPDPGSWRWPVIR